MQINIDVPVGNGDFNEWKISTEFSDWTYLGNNRFLIIYTQQKSNGICHYYIQEINLNSSTPIVGQAQIIASFPTIKNPRITAINNSTAVICYFDEAGSENGVVQIYDDGISEELNDTILPNVRSDDVIIKKLNTNTLRFYILNNGIQIYNMRINISSNEVSSFSLQDQNTNANSLRKDVSRLIPIPGTNNFYELIAENAFSLTNGFARIIDNLGNVVSDLKNTTDHQNLINYVPVNETTGYSFDNSLLNSFEVSIVENFTWDNEKRIIFKYGLNNFFSDTDTIIFDDHHFLVFDIETFRHIIYRRLSDSFGDTNSATSVPGGIVLDTDTFARRTHFNKNGAGEHFTKINDNTYVLFYISELSQRDPEDNNIRTDSITMKVLEI